MYFYQRGGELFKLWEKDISHKNSLNKAAPGSPGKGITRGRTAAKRRQKLGDDLRFLF